MHTQAVVVNAGGRLTVALYTIRPVAPGEELTFDYASVTESEEEFKQAFCMCSTRCCRGSYLHYTGKAYMQVRVGVCARGGGGGGRYTGCVGLCGACGAPTPSAHALTSTRLGVTRARPCGHHATQVVEERHTFLDRQVVLLRACSEPLTDADRVGGTHACARDACARSCGVWRMYALQRLMAPPAAKQLCRPNCVCVAPRRRHSQARLDAAGLRASVLGRADLACNPRIPDWLMKWASLTLTFVEQERELLPQVCVYVCVCVC
jgi:hypothetical protein